MTPREYIQLSKNQLRFPFAALAYTAVSAVFVAISIVTMKTLVFYFAGWCDQRDHALLLPVFACIFSKVISVVSHPGYGVPAEWLDDVRNATEDTLLELADHLPSEAAEALLDLATGVAPKVAKPVVAGADPFAHPDAQRRFRVMVNVEELERALEYPWDKWTIFLHPSQRALVER